MRSPISSPGRAIAVIFAVLAGTVPFAFGSANATECLGVQLQPGLNTVQDIVRSKPEGTRFCFNPGVYRLRKPIEPRKYDKFVGLPGAVLNGSKILTLFTKSGDHWVASGQTQQAKDLRGRCEWRPKRREDSNYTGCMYPEGVYFDNRALWQVMKRSNLGPGKFYFDYANDKIYLADNPVGHKVEASVAPMAFRGGGHSKVVRVTVRGLVIEKFANKAAVGAINSGPKWIFENNEVRLNHGTGIAAYDGGRVVNDRIHHKCQLGLAVKKGSDGLVAGNEISYNNTARFRYAWEAGGTKFWNTRDLIVRNNYVHHNIGIGLWDDHVNYRPLYEGNLVERNQAIGIFHEKGFGSVMRDNVIRSNGLTGLVAATFDGAGIKVASSPGTKIYGNRIGGNLSGIVFQDRPATDAPGLDVKNNYIHHNVITLPRGQVGIIDQDPGFNPYTDAANNRFDANTYRVATLEKKYWRWSEARSWKGWRSIPQDTNGQVSRM